MYRWTVLFASVLMLGLLAMGCSGGNAPTSPATTPELAGASAPQVQTHLWGYWDLYFDFENQTVEAVPNHSAEFAANVVSFLNSKGGLAFTINDTPPGPGGAVDVDINVALTHPLAGMTEYNGYDVRGIFIGEGSQTLKFSSALKCAKVDTDQFMLDDPDDDDGGGPDGYTRWWNPKEFTASGLLGYTKGNVATPGYIPTATVSPYKYFADGLTAKGDLWTFLNSTTGDGKFASGKTNTRNYYLRFPTPLPGVKYAYAVVASWKGEAPADHPANATEAVGIDVVIDPDLYFVNSSNKGGKFDADISIFDWGSDNYLLHIDTEIHTTIYHATADEMIPTGGTDTYSTYHIEFAPNNLSFNSATKGRDAEYWVIVEYPDADYVYPEAPAPPAPTANLAAFFRFNDLFIADESYNQPPVVESGVDGNVSPFFKGTSTYSVTASDPDGDTLTYAWTVTDVASGTKVITDDPGNGDGTIDVNFATLGATNGQEFDIDCTVSDGIATADATTLRVTATNVIYHWDGTNGAGDMSHACDMAWTYYSALQAWKQGTESSYNVNERGALQTPVFACPSGVSSLNIEFKHWGNIESFWDGGALGVSTNGGSTWTWHGITSFPFTYVSGQNWNYNYLVGWLFNPGGPCGFPSNYYNSSYSNFCMAMAFGSSGSPVTSTFSFNGSIGQSNLRVGFGMCADSSVQYFGWAIREVTIYAN